MLMLRPHFKLQTLAPLLAFSRPSPSTSSTSSSLPFLLRRRRPLSLSALRPDHSAAPAAAAAPPKSKAPPQPPPGLVRTALFVPPGVPREAGAAEMVVLPGSNIVVGPYAGDARIREVEFAKSSARPRDCPRDDRPEFAVIGRSNVGKSSLINALVRRKDVALTSKKPGKTQLINHFLINKSWYIVDLPGYGFANAPESARMDWSSFTKGYFLNRNTLVGVLLLVDASVPPQQIDLDCANWLGRNNREKPRTSSAIVFIFKLSISWCDLRIFGGTLFEISVFSTRRDDSSTVFFSVALRCTSSPGLPRSPISTIFAPVSS